MVPILKLHNGELKQINKQTKQQEEPTAQAYSQWPNLIKNDKSEDN